MMDYSLRRTAIVRLSVSISVAMECQGCVGTQTEWLGLVRDRVALYEFLVAHGVIPVQVRCSNCDNPATRTKDYSFWRCYKKINGLKCNTKVSIKSLSIFKFSKLHLRDCFSIVARLLFDPPPMLTRLMFELNMTHMTAIKWTQTIREVFAYWYTHSMANKIGGPGHVVEIDETKLCKIHIEHNGVRHVWAIGCIDRTTHDVRVQVLPDRREITLTGMVRRHVCVDSIVHTDGWLGYSALARNGYNHLRVNHRFNFVNPHNGAHIQTIERFWREMKSYFRPYGLDHSLKDGFLGEFLFKRKFSKANIIHEFFGLFHRYMNREQ